MKDILNAIEKLPGDARRQIYDLLKREFGADSDADQEGDGGNYSRREEFDSLEQTATPTRKARMQSRRRLQKT